MQNKPNLVRRRRIANEHKYLLHKGLSKFYPAGGAKKQTQFKPKTNPIKPNLRDAQNERKFNINKGL